MVALSIRDGTLLVRMRGLGMVLALKRRLRIPLACIAGVHIDDEAAHGFWKGVRLPGTHIPGLLVAGTFHRGGRRTFWSVRRGRRAVVIDLENARYDRLVLEVADPDGAVRMLTDALRGWAFQRSK